jgi:glycerol-3-phosphate acyltransferase PlsY
MSTSSIATAVACVVLGYFVGAIPFGLLVARWRRGIDIRRYGSGSTGATNVLRTLGWKASLLVFLADLGKSVLPVLLARMLTASAWVTAATGVAVIVGHCWSIYTGWTGGRGATSSLGGILVIQPLVGVGSFVVAIVAMAASRYASLGSLLGVGFGTLVMIYLLATGAIPLGDVVYIIGSPLLVYVRHRDNIRRLG